jgi:hypothetical protein
VPLHLLERIGRLLRFSPVGRSVRVWVEGMPGADETRVVTCTITELRDGGAVVYLRESELEPRWILAVPRDAGWGLQALWFSFIRSTPSSSKTASGWGSGTSGWGRGDEAGAGTTDPAENRRIASPAPFAPQRKLPKSGTLPARS